MFKDALSDPNFSWKQGGGALIRQFKLNKKHMAQLPDGGKGYITRAELLEKLDIPEHVFTSGKSKARVSDGFIENSLVTQEPVTCDIVPVAIENSPSQSPSIYIYKILTFSSSFTNNPHPTINKIDNNNNFFILVLD